MESFEKSSFAPLLLNKALQASSCAITIADAKEPDMPLIYVNDTFYRLTGYPVEEALGRNCRFLQGKDRKQEAIKDIRDAIKNQKETTVVLKNYRKDGTLFWNELHIAPVIDLDGKLTHYIGVQTDVTDRIQAEIERKKYRESLEQTVKERTQELNQKNIALTELVSQIGIEKKRLQDQMIANVDQSLLPLIRRAKENPKQLQKALDLIEENLLEITSDFGAKLSRKAYHLTQRELEICNFIKGGLSSKEIANHYNVALSTIDNHRNTIRKKLGISNKKVNLVTFLKTFSEEN